MSTTLILGRSSSWSGWFVCQQLAIENNFSPFFHWIVLSRLIGFDTKAGRSSGFYTRVNVNFRGRSCDPRCKSSIPDGYWTGKSFGILDTRTNSPELDLDLVAPYLNSSFFVFFFLFFSWKSIGGIGSTKTSDTIRNMEFRGTQIEWNRLTRSPLDPLLLYGFRWDSVALVSFAGDIPRTSYRCDMFSMFLRNVGYNFVPFAPRRPAGRDDIILQTCTCALLVFPDGHLIF